jgi:hypothetical protein
VRSAASTCCRESTGAYGSPAGESVSSNGTSLTRRRRRHEVAVFTMARRTYATGASISDTRDHRRWVFSSADWTRSSA